MHRVLVIGATGNVGREVVRQLSDWGPKVRALARRPESAAFPPEVEVVRGDLTVPESLDPCLDGVDAVFLVWMAPASAAAPALKCILRRVGRVVYLSAAIKTQHPLFQASLPNPSSVLHTSNERTIAESGVEWTILRPGMFAANAREWWGPQIRAGGLVRWPYLEAPTAPIDERDMAAIGVRALCQDGHAGREYVITGPRSLTQREQIEVIGRAIGRTLRIEEMPAEEARRTWPPAFPAPAVEMLLKAWAAAVGLPAYVSSTFQEIAGEPPHTFEEWAAANTASFC